MPQWLTAHFSRPPIPLAVELDNTVIPLVDENENKNCLAPTSILRTEENSATTALDFRTLSFSAFRRRAKRKAFEDLELDSKGVPGEASNSNNSTRKKLCRNRNITQ